MNLSLVGIRSVEHATTIASGLTRIHDRHPTRIGMSSQRQSLRAGHVDLDRSPAEFSKCKALGCQRPPAQRAYDAGTRKLERSDL